MDHSNHIFDIDIKLYYPMWRLLLIKSTMIPVGSQMNSLRIDYNPKYFKDVYYLR